MSTLALLLLLAAQADEPVILDSDANDTPPAELQDGSTTPAPDDTPIEPAPSEPVVTTKDAETLSTSPVATPPPFPNLLTPSRYALAAIAVVGAGSFLVGGGLVLLGNYVYAVSAFERSAPLFWSSMGLVGSGLGLMAVAGAAVLFFVVTTVISNYFRDFFPSEKAPAR